MSTEAKGFLSPPAKSSIVDSRFRWVIITLACLAVFGDYYCLDNPQALQYSIIRHFGIDNTQYGLLYTVYAIPNIIVPLVGGILTDFFGVRVVLFIASFLVVMGQAITTLGAENLVYSVMVFGRFIFGLGAEILPGSLMFVLNKWFPRDGSFAMGTLIGFSRLASACNSWLSPLFYAQNENLTEPLLNGTYTCMLSFILLVPLARLEKKLEKEDKSKNMILKHTMKVEKEEEFTWDVLYKFNRMYWLMVLNSLVVYTSFFGLMDNINDLMIERFGYTQESAGDFISIVYLFSAFFSPFAGGLADRYGKRVTIILWTLVILIFSHLFIAFLEDRTQDDPNYLMVIGLVGTGIFYSIYAAVFWALIPMVCDKKTVGTGLGFIIAVHDISQVVIPVGIGYIHDKTLHTHFGYFWTQILLLGFGVIGFIATWLMYREDILTGSKLENTKNTTEQVDQKPMLAELVVQDKDGLERN